MATTANVTIRMDAELKSQLEVFYAELGLSLTSAFVMYGKQCLREQRIPFQPSLNPTTVQALEEADRMIETGNFKRQSVSEALKELKNA